MIQLGKHLAGVLCALALSAPLFSQPKITGIEVNQSIGNQLNGNLNFVAGKDTVVRAFLDGATAIDTSISRTFLSVFKDGSLLATVATSSAGPTAVVDFLCDRSACANWAAGSYRFEATVNGGAKQTTDGTAYNFVARAGLRILVRPVKANFGGKITSVRGTDWKTAWSYLRRTYPVAADQILWDIREDFDASAPRYDLETDDGRLALWTSLTSLLPEHCLANSKGTGCYDLIVGFISDRPNGYPNGTLQGYTYGRPTNIVVASDEDMMATLAHEIAHIYGAGDTYAGGSLNCGVNPAPDGVSGKDFTDPEKPATCTAGRGAYPEGNATLIPAAAHAFDALHGSLPDMADFMGSGTLQKNFWITPDVYDLIFKGLGPPPAAQTAVLPNRFALTGTVVRAADANWQRVLYFEGALNASGQARMQPWYSGETAEPLTDSRGDTMIVAVDAAGAILASREIRLQFFVLTNPPRTVTWAPFEGAIRFPDGTSKFQVVQKGTVLYEAKVTVNDPRITGVSPVATGITLDGAQTIIWNGTDPDGDSLNYLVEFNPRPSDAASDWIVLAAHLTTPQWQDDFSTLPGTTAGLIRITATDGARSGHAVSQYFAVPFKPPVVAVDALSPSTFKTTDLIELTGEAEDLQDGTLDGKSLVWTSNLGGTLGTGSVIHATGLARGTHTITLTATNSAGLKGTQSIQIQVQ